MIDSYVLTKKALNEVHSHSFKNKSEITESKVCHCFYCKKAFASSDVTEWADEGETAKCPKCGVDAVMGDAAGYEMTPALLNEMHDHWFERQILPDDFDYSLFEPLEEED